MNKLCPVVLMLALGVFADATYTKNKKANNLYEQGEYQKALELYDEALIESPDEKKLSINKGSAYYKMGQMDQALQEYQNAAGIEDKKSRANLLYNMGNTLFLQGEKMASSGGQEAMETLESAKASYIQALDLDPRDTDAKHNLEMVQHRIEQLKQQQQDQQNKDNQENKDKDKDKDKDQQDKDRQDQKQDQKQDQDQQQDQQQEKEDPQKSDQQEQQERNKEEQREEQQQDSQPEQKESSPEEQMKRQEALRLLQQFADDAKELNKPKKQMRAGQGHESEKDW